MHQAAHRLGGRRSIGAVILSTALLLAAAAPAFADSGPLLSVLAPTSSVAKGSTPTFKVQLTKRGHAFINEEAPWAVFVVVSRRKDRDGDGILKNPVFLSKMNGDSTFTATPANRSYPAYWLRQPGTYYWQSYVIQCKPNATADCKHEIAPRTLKVRKN